MEQKIIHGDCLEEMRKLGDNCIDLVVIDPPYNIGKDTWDKIDNYEEWMKEVFIEIQRVLKDNGSFYWWHNNMPVISKLMNIIESDTNFIFRQMIVWNKRFDGAKRKGFLDGYVILNDLNNYNKMSEYCLFYTFDNTYKIKQTRLTLGIKQTTISKEILSKNGGMTGWFSNIETGKYFPTKETIIPITKHLGLSMNDLVYTFNNQKTHHSVWNYDIDKKIGHITPKPLDMIKNIIRHSSNEGDIVLDCFGGSGTTAVACKELGRNCIMIESKGEYIDLINKRLDGATPLN